MGQTITITFTQCIIIQVKKLRNIWYSLIISLIKEKLDWCDIVHLHYCLIMFNYSSYVNTSGTFLPFVLLDNILQLHFDICHQCLLVFNKQKNSALLIRWDILIHFKAPAIKFKPRFAHLKINPWLKEKQKGFSVLEKKIKMTQDQEIVNTQVCVLVLGFLLLNWA